MIDLIACCSAPGAFQSPIAGAFIRMAEVAASLVIVFALASYQGVPRSRVCLGGVMAAVMCGAFSVNAFCLCVAPHEPVTMHELITALLTLAFARCVVAAGGNAYKVFRLNT